MAYTKQNFKNGQTLTAEQLTYIEDGIVALNEAIELLKNDNEGSTETTDSPIKYVESSDDNLLNLRDFESGTYVLYGRFRAYNGSTATISFASALLVNIVTKTAGTHVQVFYPVNNCVQFLDITDNSYKRTNVYLNDLLASVEALSRAATARVADVNLLAANWTGSENLYSQVVSIDGVTEFSQVDLTPSVEQLVIFYEKDLTFVAENDGGVVTVYAIGQMPTNDYTIQVTITEVTV